MTRLFLDTTVVISSITARNPASVILVSEKRYELVVDEYVIKETRRVLSDEFEFSDQDVNRSIDFIRENMTVVPMPSKNEFKKLNMKDKSDRPIVCSAKRNNCILVTEDGLLHTQAKKYVVTVRPDEV